MAPRKNCAREFDGFDRPVGIAVGLFGEFANTYFYDVESREACGKLAESVLLSCWPFACMDGASAAPGGSLGSTATCALSGMGCGASEKWESIWVCTHCCSCSCSQQHLRHLKLGAHDFGIDLRLVLGVLLQGNTTVTKDSRNNTHTNTPTPFCPHP